MTGKPLPFSHRSRSNRREHRYNSRHRSPNKFSQSNSQPYYDSSDFRLLSRSYNRDENRSRKENYSRVMDFVKSKIMLTRFLVKNRQTAQCLTLKKQTRRMSPRKHSSNNNLMIFSELNQDTQEMFYLPGGL